MKPPPFVSVHQVYMPPFGEDNAWGARRWQAHNLSGVDRDGNVWGLYVDTLEPFVAGKQPKLYWLKFEAEVK